MLQCEGLFVLKGAVLRSIWIHLVGKLGRIPRCEFQISQGNYGMHTSKYPVVVILKGMHRLHFSGLFHSESNYKTH